MRKRACALAHEINKCLPMGLPASFHEAVSATITDIAFFANMIEKGGTWTTVDDLSEGARCNRSCANTCTPVTFLSPREPKLVAERLTLFFIDRIVVENKVGKERVRDPFAVGPHYAWQARRYGMALCSRVVAVVFAYRPTDEAARLPLPRSDSRVRHARSRKKTGARFESSCHGEEMSLPLRSGPL